MTAPYDVSAAEHDEMIQGQSETISLVVGFDLYDVK